MNARKRCTNLFLVLAIAAITPAVAVRTSAQVKTEKSTETGQATHTVRVERGEVIRVEGNDLFVKMENGEIRHFPNIPESARATVDGNQLGIHDLKPGMKLQRTITTTKTPKTVTTVESVTGTVWAVMPPTSVTLRLENGEVQRFNIPKGQKFTIEGKETDAFGLRKGMKVSATRITEASEAEMALKVTVSGTMPTPPSPPPAGESILIAEAPPKAPAQAQEVPAKLPKTGSIIPLLGLLGLLSVGASFGLRILRQA